MSNCSDQGEVAPKAINANPGLRIVRIMNFSIQMFFTAFESWAPGVVRHYSKSKGKANPYTQKTLIQS